MSRLAHERTVTRLAAMPFGPRKTLAALTAAALALAAAGCGSSDDKSIPPTSADQLLAQLDGVRDQVENGTCELAKSQAIQFKSSVDSLPSDVQADTKTDLNQLADNLIELADDPSQCEQEEGASGPSGAVTDETTTETSVPETTQTTTEETTTKPEEEAQPAEPQQQQQPSGEGAQGNEGGGVSDNIGGGDTGTIGPKPGGGGGG